MCYNINMTRIKKKAFFYPSQDANVSSASPSDQANTDLQKKQKQNTALINLTEGVVTKEGFATNNQVSEVHYHHENVSYLPYGEFTHLDTPQQARTQYPFTHRLGNSSTRAQGIVKYETRRGVNVGPFNLYVQK